MSSDSDDDFYGNMTERLQKEKDKIFEDKTEIATLFDDSNELDEIVENNKSLAKTTRKRGRKAAEEVPGCSGLDLPSVSVGNVASTSCRRTTRSRAKSSGELVPTNVELPKRCSKRGRKTTNARVRSDDEDDENTGSSFGDIVDVNTRGRARNNRARGRSRGRSRGRGGGTPRRRRRNVGFWAHSDNVFEMFASILAAEAEERAGRRSNNAFNPSIPIYSIGNTDEYPDQSHNQPLFSKPNIPTPKTDDVVIVEEENEDNEELSVKVYWQSSEFFKFMIRRFQKLTQIFDYFAKKENVSHDKLLFTYNDKIIKSDDTPDSIEYSIVKFIDGGVVSEGVTKELLAMNEDNIKDGIKLKFQCQNMKKPLEIAIKLDDKMSVAMSKCSELLEKPLDKLKFIFDGEVISGKTTADEMEFEGGECIDVRIIS